MKIRLTFIIGVLVVPNLYASTGTEQAKMVVMALAAIVVIGISSFIRKKKNKD